MVLVALIPTLSLTAGAAAWWPAGAEISEAGGTSHVVRAGETLYSIARTHGTDVATLVALNGLKDPSRIQAGQVLVLVPAERTPDPAPDAAATAEPAASEAWQYTVLAGDTMFGVARRFGVAVQALLAANSLTNPNLIQIGQVLTVPGPLAIPNGTERPSIGAEIVPRPTPYPPPVTPPTPPAGPVGSGAALPAGLFGRSATDPARLAMTPSFDRWATHYRIDRNLLKGMAYVESSWRVDALSSAGAVGVGQLMPATSAWIASHLIGDPTLDPHRADDNIRMSARYVRYLIDELGVEDRAIGAYYQGIGSVQRDGMGSGTVQYIARVRAAQAAFVAG